LGVNFGGKHHLEAMACRNFWALPLAMACVGQLGCAQDDGGDKMHSEFFCPPRDYRREAVMVPLVGDPDHFLTAVASKPPGRGARARVAIVVIHGGLREAEPYYDVMMKVVKKHNQHDSTLVVAPGFADRPCSSAEWLKGSSLRHTGAVAAYWGSSSRQWMFGAESDHNATWKGVTSFEAIDSIFPWVSKEYLGVEHIILAGFSSGGQMVLRWAITSTEGIDGKTKDGKELRIVIGSPSTVMYLDEKRPAKKCSPNEDTGKLHHCHDFQVQAADVCGPHDYDQYGFGLGGLRWHSGVGSSIRLDVSNYVHATTSKSDQKHLRSTLVKRFASKDIRFLFGSHDTKSCLKGICSGDCQSMTQGANRLQRGLNYMGHLENAIPGYKAIFGIFEGGHDHIKAFNSDHFGSWAFHHGRGKQASVVAHTSPMHKATERVVQLEVSVGGTPRVIAPHFDYIIN